MSIETVATKTARDIIGSAVPEAVYLFASFFRRRARKFRTISEHGTLFRRVTITAALALICGFASLFVMQLDPFEGIEGLMGARERAVWAALVPLIAGPPLWWLLRRFSPESVFWTFLNLGLVTTTALMVIPSILALAGANVSALASDIDKLRAGRAGGTPVHALYCGSIETRAEMEATMRQSNRLTARIVQNGHSLQTNTRQLDRNRQEMDAAGHRMLRAREAGQPEEALVRELFQVMQRGTDIMERGLEIHERGLKLHEQAIELDHRYIDLQNRQTTAPLRLIAAYPVAAFFAGIAFLVAILIWLFAAVIVWRLTVAPQVTRQRKALAGASVVILFAGLWIGFGLLRSGFAEAMIQEIPSREMLLAQIRSQFEAATPMCGRLNNHGLW